MLYLIYIEYITNLLKKHLFKNPSYLIHLQLLQDEGRLLTAGLIPAIDSNDPSSIGFTGSFFIAEFESLESAIAWTKKDPYVNFGIYKKISVKPYRKIF